VAKRTSRHGRRAWNQILLHFNGISQNTDDCARPPMQPADLARFIQGEASNLLNCTSEVTESMELRRFLSRNLPAGLSSRPASTLRQPAHTATMGGLPLCEGERESGASWHVSLRQSPYLRFAIEIGILPVKSRMRRRSTVDLAPDFDPKRVLCSLGAAVLQKLRPHALSPSLGTGYGYGKLFFQFANEMSFRVYVSDIALLVRSFYNSRQIPSNEVHQ
jgi:hypothetical protein